MPVSGPASSKPGRAWSGPPAGQSRAWGNLGGILGEPWGKPPDRHPQATRLRPSCDLQASSLLLGPGQHGFEVRGLFFAGDDADFDSLEPSRFEPAVQIAFRETGPPVAI